MALVVAEGGVFIVAEHAIYCDAIGFYAAAFAAGIVFNRVRDYLIDRKIAPGRFVTKGFGTGYLWLPFFREHPDNRRVRIDTLVEVAPPDAKAAERLVKLYARGLLAPEVGLAFGRTSSGLHL
ncbi:MAG: hypothetical protein ACJ8AW_48600 [Rhodopila sp.]